MIWRDKLGKVEMPDGRRLIGASFRGVAFFVEAAELEGGRRGVKHEYPMRDKPFVEDLGRRARIFPIEGYVLGADYLSQRDSLLGALETSGAGELLHPHYGTRRVFCSAFRVRESSMDGGIARFAITFEETELSPSFPSAVGSGSDLVATASDAVESGASDDLVSRYSTDGQPIAALASLTALVTDASAATRSAIVPLVTVMEDRAQLERRLTALEENVATLVRVPADLASDLVAVVAPLESIDALQGLRALLRVYDFVPSIDRPPATTGTREREQANYDVLLGFIRTQAVVQASRLAPAASYDSHEQAVETRDSLCSRIEEQMESADDLVFQALDQLRAELMRAIPGTDSDLPHLISYTPGHTMPSLVLAHVLYGNVDREGDILTRNSLRRPGFVPGGAALEVLSV